MTFRLIEAEKSTASCLPAVQRARRDPRRLLRLAATQPVADGRSSDERLVGADRRRLRASRSRPTARRGSTPSCADDHGDPGRTQAGRPADAPARHRGRLASRQAPLQDDDPGERGARRRRTSSVAASRRAGRTGSGSPTSPTSPTWEGCLFLACVHRRLEPPDRRLVDARRSQGRACRRRARDGADPPQPQPGLVHHSDRGSQYT